MQKGGPSIRENQRIVIALLVLFVFWCGWQSKYSSQRPSSNPDSAAKHDDADNKQRQQEGWWESARKPIAVFTFLLVTVGAVQVGFFYRQLDLIRKSLGPAEQAANAAQDAASVAQA
jgi:hypothetical protein